VESVGRDGFGLALRLDRFDRLRHDGVTNEAIRRLADQDLAGGGRLLKTSGGVHGIAGHERLAPTRVAGYHLAGVDPRPRGDLDPELVSELLVQGRQSLTHPDS